MNNIITEYQKWKQQGKDLRSQAKGAMEVRYKELLLEAIQVAEEYKADFGGSLKLPPAVTAFRFKAPAKSKAHAAAKPAGAKAAPKAAATPVKAEAAAPSKLNPKVTALQKKLDGARKKLDTAKAAGTPTKNLEDRVYELEDDLRLATQAG